MTSPINPYQKQLDKFKARDHAEMIGQMDSKAYRAMIEAKAKEFDANQPKPIKIKCHGVFDKDGMYFVQVFMGRDSAEQYVGNFRGGATKLLIIELTGSYTP